MAVVHKYGGDNRLAVRILWGLIILTGWNHSWPALVGHVFGFHREGCRWWVFKAEFASEVEGDFEKWVEAEIGS
jgi:hypothetical protein